MFEETSSSLTEALGFAGWPAADTAALTRAPAADTAAVTRPIAVDGAAETFALGGELGAVSEVATLGDPLAAREVPCPSRLARTGGSGLLTDAAALVVAVVLAAAGHSLWDVLRVGGSPLVVFAGSAARLAVTAPLLLAVLSDSRRSPRVQLRGCFGHQLRTLVVPLTAAGVASLGVWQVVAGLHVVPPSAGSVLLLCLAGVLLVAAGRAGGPWTGRAGLGARRVLVIGSGRVAGLVTERLRSQPGVHIVGFVDDEPMCDDGWLGGLSDLPAVCLHHRVDNVVVAFSKASEERLIEVLRPVQGHVAIAVIPRLFDVVPATAGVHDLGAGLPAISVAPASFGWLPTLVKRAVDLVGAVSALVVLSPLLAVVAAAVRCTSPGPVILRQTRVGRDGQHFPMFKFRSMYLGTPRPPDTAAGCADETGAACDPVTGPFPKLKNDPRVTPVGRLIRRSSIDELPQLLNVVLGHMSLVGPRPFVPSDAACIAGWARRRYHVRPGITGLWQVSGRNDITFEEMCRLDHLYVSCWSFGLDLRILVRTARVVLARRGAY